MSLEESRTFFAEIKTGNPSFVDKLIMLGVNEDAIISAAKQLVIPSQQSYFVRLAKLMKNGKNRYSRTHAPKIAINITMYQNLNSSINF